MRDCGLRAAPQLGIRRYRGIGGLVALLVVVAVLGGLSSLKEPVDLVSLGVSPLAHPVLEPGQQHERDRVGRGRSDRADDDLGVGGMNGDWAGIGPVMISTGSAYGRGMTRVTWMSEYLWEGQIWVGHH